MATTRDLVGEISNYPLAIVQAMVNNQVAQGNKENVNVFQIDPTATLAEGGFDWGASPEGKDYWYSVVYTHNFSMPRTQPRVGDVIDVTRLDGRKVKDVVCVGYIPSIKFPVLYVTKRTWEMIQNDDSNLLPNPNVYMGVIENKVRLTLKDISEGKGVGVDPSLIEIVNE